MWASYVGQGGGPKILFEDSDEIAGGAKSAGFSGFVHGHACLKTRDGAAKSVARYVFAKRASRIATKACHEGGSSHADRVGKLLCRDAIRIVLGDVSEGQSDIRGNLRALDLGPSEIGEQGKKIQKEKADAGGIFFFLHSFCQGHAFLHSFLIGVEHQAVSLKQMAKLLPLCTDLRKKIGREKNVSSFVQRVGMGDNEMRRVGAEKQDAAIPSLAGDAFGAVAHKHRHVSAEDHADLVIAMGVKMIHVRRVALVILHLEILPRSVVSQILCANLHAVSPSAVFIIIVQN